MASSICSDTPADMVTPCSICSMHKKFVDENIWVHQGNGSLNKAKLDPMRTHFVPELSDLLPSTTFVDSFFTERKDEQQICHKPQNVVWFSHGRWLFDPYYDKRDGLKPCTNVDHHEGLNGVACVLIQNPENILTIRSLKELNHFTETYASIVKSNESLILEQKNMSAKDDFFCQAMRESPKCLKTIQDGKLGRVFADTRKLFDDTAWLTHGAYDVIKQLSLLYPDVLFYSEMNDFSCLRGIVEYVRSIVIDDCPTIWTKDYSKINWTAVQASGVYGVAFEFRKAYELPEYDKSTRFDCKYRWHDGFDVESLCVWDFRAFDNTVHPILLSS
jgi:hypothetical protein